MNNPPRPRPKLLTDDGNGSFTEHGQPQTEKPRRIIPIVKQSGYLISPSRLTEEEIEDLASRYRHKFYNEAACAKCELYAERHSETCDSCGAYQGEVDLAGPTVVADKSGKEHPVIKAPLGRKNKFVKWLKHHGFVPQVTDAQVDNKPIAPFKLVRKPYDYQIEAVMAAIAAEKGILSSPPRTGKTIMMTMVVQRLKQKTLILAHQREWLTNFHDTFVGNENEPAFTDIDPSRIGFAKTYEDFERFDVAFATFQQFFKDKGMLLFQRIVHLFPITIVDECQFAPAPESVKLMTKVVSRYRYGSSGTATRKDRRHVIFTDQVGDIFFEVKAETMTPKVAPFATSLNFKIYGSGPGAFVRFKRSMEASKPRQRMIASLALRMAKRDHFVIIPVGLTKTVDSLVKLINSQSDEPIARPFHGGLNKAVRKQTIEDARKYRYKIMVANIALISTGVNIPRASCLIDGVTPTSNLPKAQQRFARILTPSKDKPAPVIIYLLDYGTVKNMRRNEYYNCLVKHFKPEVSDAGRKLLKEYFADPKKTFDRDEY